MATSDNKPTDKQRFQNNIAPETKPAAKSSDEAKRERNEEDNAQPRKPADLSKPAEPVQEDSAALRQQYQEKQEEEFQARVEASRKKSPVDALGLPEGEGDEIWSNAVEVAPRDSVTDEDGKPVKETDKAYEKRVEEGEAALVKGATEFLNPLFGSLRPLGYSLTKTDTHIRLAIVNTEANPDPSRVGGKPNENGQY